MRFELIRSYKNGFVWHDLSEDDLIIPAHGHDYILKGSAFLDNPTSAQDYTRRRNKSYSSIDFDSKSTQTDDRLTDSKELEIEISPPPSDSSPETLGTLLKADGQVMLLPEAAGHRHHHIHRWTVGPGAGCHLKQLTGRPPDVLCGHLTQLEDGAAYESAFAAIHHRRLNWIPILQMQTYFSIADVTAELKKVVEKKISENDAEVNKAQGDCAAAIDGEEKQKDNNHHNFQRDLEIEAA
ncbi:hypothetical protein SASPL_117732 [Salvia splendens]|uniref:SOSEKI DIX-like domain-containing protein n=1 Tax=Salvia splendens TaxID=180675 RepID=A0A8X8ZXV0_SALSN|nr:hypothetical protein SASPL_117732 [Salvia splendens]